LFNNSNTNEDIATKFEQEYFHISPSKSSIWALSKKLETNILINGKIIKEMPGSVASGTPCITYRRFSCLNLCSVGKNEADNKKFRNDNHIPGPGFEPETLSISNSNAII